MGDEMYRNDNLEVRRKEGDVERGAGQSGLKLNLACSCRFETDSAALIVEHSLTHV